MKNEVMDDQNYLGLVKKFNEDSEIQIAEHKKAVA